MYSSGCLSFWCLLVMYVSRSQDHIALAGPWRLTSVKASFFMVQRVSGYMTSPAHFPAVEPLPVLTLLLEKNVRVCVTSIFSCKWVMHELVYMSAQHGDTLCLPLPSRSSSLSLPNFLLVCPTEGNSYSLVIMWRMMCALKCALPGWLPLRRPAGAVKEGHRENPRLVWGRPLMGEWWWGQDNGSC